MTLAPSRGSDRACRNRPDACLRSREPADGHPTEEARALRWNHVVAWTEEPGEWQPVTEAGFDHERFAIYVWRSVRAHGDTKTRKSRRTLELPNQAAKALRAPCATVEGAASGWATLEGSRPGVHQPDRRSPGRGQRPSLVPEHHAEGGSRRGPGRHVSCGIPSYRS